MFLRCNKDHNNHCPGPAPNTPLIIFIAHDCGWASPTGINGCVNIPEKSRSYFLLGAVRPHKDVKEVLLNCRSSQTKPDQMYCSKKVQIINKTVLSQRKHPGNCSQRQGQGFDLWPLTDKTSRTYKCDWNLFLEKWTNIPWYIFLAWMNICEYSRVPWRGEIS